VCPAEDSITEITLVERSSWIGFLIKITLRSDQTAVTIQPDWEEERVRKTKTFQGKFYDFGRLARALEAQGFFRLRDKYLAGDTDLNTVNSAYNQSNLPESSRAAEVNSPRAPGARAPAFTASPR